MKKYISYLGVLILACFSFYYTDKATDIVKRNDPIMKSIMKNSDNYFTKPVNAVVTNDEIMPGINGLKVDIDKSYSKMKKTNTYDELMFVYKEVKPDISFINEYDKYIISGNKSISNISLVFKVKDYSYLEKLDSILTDKNIPATLFIDGLILENYIDNISNIISNEIELENLGYDGEYNKEKFIWTNNLIASLTRKDPLFCYTDYKASDVIDLCSKYNMYTIKPTISISNYPFLTVKRNLTNGVIISFNLNDEVLKELPSIISYIKQKGYNIVTLSNLINENIVEEK